MSKKTIKYSDGKYVGEVKDGIRHGKGTFTGTDGSKYVGEWKDNERHGKGEGIDIYDNGKYVGEFKDGIRHGQGTYTWQDGASFGDKFVGEFKDGKRWKGTYKFKAGKVRKIEKGVFIKEGVLGKLATWLEKGNRKGYQEINKPQNSSKKKSGLGTFLLGGLAAKAATAPQGRPTVVFDNPDVVVTKMKHKFGGEWSVWYGVRDSKNRIDTKGYINCTKYKKSGSVGGYNYTVFFS